MLSGEYRLKRTADFKKAYTQGLYAAAKQIVIYYRQNSSSQLRIGFVASKKIGQSHVRTRCKRLMREAMRAQLPRLSSGYDLVVVARPPIIQEDYQGVATVMVKLLKKAKLIGDTQ